MASAYVPPPPEEDFLGFSTQQEEMLSQPDAFFTKPSLPVSNTQPFEGSHFGGDGFIESTLPSSHCHLSSRSSSSSGRLSSQSGGFSSHTSTLDSQFSEGSSELHAQRVPKTPALSSTQLHRLTPMTNDCRLDFSFDAPNEPGGRGHIGLRSVTEIPEMYRSVFKGFSHFNLVQSKVFDDVMYTDSPMVTSAPTGSGKTVLFELAIVRLLMQLGGQMASAKIIYVAPIKALCTERFEDWQTKFGPLGLKCCELTGDSQLDDYFELQNAQIVMTTPEKWDSMTRKWRDHKSLVQLVRLFLIDEVHQLNDETRGPTMEAIVSRMKTIRSSLLWDDVGGVGAMNKLRFIAVSATMPNISDVAAWLGSNEDAPALEYAIDESHRPVRLRKVVLGYPDATSEFKFDFSLNYRLSGVIQSYSDQKPTLVFCATRKGTQQAASTLTKDARFVMNSQHKQRLVCVANSLKDGKLRDLVVYGVGYHHAGMDVTDRKAIEGLFTTGELPVLFATSTLAMGVNLPAHLVVIKSTMHYLGGMFQECSESQVLQMIGRAGRPQFDTTATAVIMTRNSTKMKYEALIGGTQLIESSLHHHLIEHLNAEIVLNTITDVSIALEWLRSTFFYIRVKQNPKHYGLPEQHEQKEEKLQQLCLKHLHMLEESGLVTMEDGFTLQPTETGKLMARYYIAFESMKRFLGFSGKEDLSTLVCELSQCKEFEDVRLRMNERKVLNTLNKDKNRQTIRFSMNGKIKTTDMKVSCLIQANLGCLPIQEFGLNQDTQKIVRAASRLSKCLMELEMLSNNFDCLLSAVLLHKCLQARLWENSKYVSKQLDKIGLTLSTTLVNAGVTTFDKIQQTTPRELELIMNRHPPFGNQISEAVSKLPRYSLSVEQSPTLLPSQAELTIQVKLSNFELLKESRATTGSRDHSVIMLVGDQDNRIVCRQRLNNSQLMSSGQFFRKLSIQRSTSGDDLKMHIISLDMVGLDIQEVYTPRYTVDSLKRLPQPSMAVGGSTMAGPSRAVGSGGGVEYRKACNHRCINKAVCGHECCKTGVIVKKSRPSLGSAEAVSMPKRPQPVSIDKRKAATNTVGEHSSVIHARTSSVPNTPRIRSSSAIYSPRDGHTTSTPSLYSRYSYTPKPSLKTSYRGPNTQQHKSSFDYGSSFGEASQSSAHIPQRPSSQYKQHSEQDQHFDFEFEDDKWLSESFSDDVQPSVSMDTSEWFDPDIAYFTTDQHTEKPTQTPIRENIPRRNLIHALDKESSQRGRPTRQSSVSKMLALSKQLQKEQSVVLRTAETRLPQVNKLNSRKRLIDKVFDELIEPTPQSVVKAANPPPPNAIPVQTNLGRKKSESATPVSQVFDPPSSKKAKTELANRDKSFKNQPLSFPGKTEATLSKKLSSQMRQTHTHTEMCTDSYDLFDGTQTEPLASLYDADTPTNNKPQSNQYSFFTAGPVSNEEEEGDLFSSVFAGIF